MRNGSTLLSWHRWGGLAATAVLLLAALTSLPLVYKKQLVHFLVAPAAELPAGYGTTDMLAELDRLAAHHPEAKHALLKAPNPEEPYWTMTAADGDIRLFELGSLEPLQRNGWLLDALEVIRELHVDLMAGLFGEYLLLTASLIGVALAVTGAILWWPARRGFRLRWVLPRSIKLPLLMQYHRHSGALVSVILALVLLTGALLLWSSLVFPLLAPLEVSSQPDRIDDIASAPPSVLLARAVRAVPDGWPTYIRIERPGTTEASVRLRLPGEWHSNGRTTVYFDTVSGAIGVSGRSDEAGPYRAVINQVYPLHSGYGMNKVYLFAVFLSGVAMLWLSVTGLISYFRRLKLRRQ